MRQSRTRGLTVVELVVALAILAILILVLSAAQSDLIRFNKRVKFDWMKHPDPLALAARVRRDVIDSIGYPDEYGSYSQDTQVLLLDGLDANGKLATIVYDFRAEGIAKRLEFVEDELISEWVAREVPPIIVTSYAMPNGGVAVRITAVNPEGGVLIDQIYSPRKNAS